MISRWDVLLGELAYVLKETIISLGRPSASWTSKDAQKMIQSMPEIHRTKKDYSIVLWGLNTRNYKKIIDINCQVQRPMTWNFFVNS